MPGRVILGGALLAAVLLIFLNTLWHYETIRTFNRVGLTAPAGGAADAVVPAGRRSIFMDIDSQMWNLFAFRVAEGEAARIRHTEFDNHPRGREVHWSSGYAWLLAGAGRLWRMAAGGDLRSAIERASLLVNPVLNAALILVAGLAAARRAGWLAGVVTALAVAGSGAILETFRPGGPDHHGLVTLAAFGAVLALALGGGGLVRVPAKGDADAGGAGALPEEREARRWFILSAVCAGAGMWVSAISMVLLLAGIGVGVLAGLLFAPGRGAPQEREREVYLPGLWPLWGAVGALTAFVFYLLEYFPGHLGLRLEVNHPLYHAAWWGGSFLLGWAGRIRCRGERPRSGDWLKIGAAAAALAALPLLLAAGGERVYALRNPMLWRWHENIFEFHALSLADFLRGFGVSGACWLLALFLLLRPGADRRQRVRVAFLLGTALLPLGLVFWQQRWGSLLAVSLALAPLAALLAGGRTAARLVDGRWVRPIVAALAVAQFLAYGLPQLAYARALKEGRTADIKLMMFTAAREAAEHLRRIEGARPVVLLSTPWPTVAMGYSGGFTGIGSLYWENLEGIRAVAEILTATSEDAALRLIRERGITHLMFMQSDYNVAAYYYNLHGRRADARDLDRMFGNLLTTGAGPWWVRQLPYRSRVSNFQREPMLYGVALFRIDPRVHDPAAGASGAR